MKNFLFVILLVVAAVLLWAIRTNAYAENGLVFSLGLVAAALSGYLISDYFSKLGNQSLTNNLQVAQKENQALRERVDLLQTQFNTATPHAEVEQFEQRTALLEEENAKLDGISRAQTAEIGSLKEKLETLQKNHSKLLEDSTISAETAKTQTVVIQDALASAKAKIQELTDENVALREHNTALTEELDAKMPATDPDTEGVIDKIVSEKTDDATVVEEKTVDDTTAVDTTATQEALASAESKIKELTDENTALREQNAHLTEKLDAQTASTDTDTERSIGETVSETTDDEIALDASEAPDNQSINIERGLLITELDTEEEDTTTENEEADYGTSDNLQAIEGIGPKVDEALKAAGVGNWEKLSMTTPERLQTILDANGKQFRAIDPTSWPEQARLLVHREFSKLKKYKEYIG